MYDSLVLSGGGPKGVIMLGLLHYYCEKKLLDLEYVTEYAGTSIGSVISLLLICGYTPVEIFQEIYSRDSLFDVSGGGLWDIIQGMGLMSISGFADKIEGMVKKKLHTVPTLSELKKMTNKTLHVSASNSTQGYEEHYSYHTHPSLGCINAVKMSCNLFPLFQKLKYRGDCIVDGGFTNNIPWDYISEGKNTLCVVVKGNDFDFLSENTFPGYAMRIFMMAVNSSSDLRCSIAPPRIKIVKAFWNQTSILQLNMTSEEKMKMFLNGYQTAEREAKTEYIMVNNWDYYEAGQIKEKDSSSEEWNEDEFLNWKWSE